MAFGVVLDDVPGNRARNTRDGGLAESSLELASRRKAWRSSNYLSVDSGDFIFYVYIVYRKSEKDDLQSAVRAELKTLAEENRSRLLTVYGHD